MLNYLINASAIWGMSLLLYHCFLRRETRHDWNRWYLLLTLTAGALLPLIPAPAPALPYTSSLQQPIRLLTDRQTPFTPATSSGFWSYQMTLETIYLAGVCLMLAQLLREIIQLIALYRNGRKWKEDGFMVVETGKLHGPFSLLHLLFVGDRQAFSGPEWRMVMAHERRHARLGHAADQLLLQVLRVLFWFHPLVYRYRHCLLLLHEYQADGAIPVPAKDYAGFLVEQTLLQGGPSFTHSFQHSPIKNRIRMLIQSPATGRHRTRLLLVLPLTLICLTGFMKLTLAQKMVQKENKFFYKGNVIELSQPERDTVTMIDPKTGETKMEVATMAPRPLMLNGKRIYTEDEVLRPKFLGKENTLTEYLFNRLRKDFGALADGDYIVWVDNVVTDENGEISFYVVDDIVLQGGGKQARPADKMTAKLKQRITEELQSAPGFTPALLNGKPVPFRANPLFGFQHLVHVAGGQVLLK